MKTRLTCPQCQDSVIALVAKEPTAIQCPACQCKMRVPGEDTALPLREAAPATARMAAVPPAVKEPCQELVAASVVDAEPVLDAEPVVVVARRRWYMVSDRQAVTLAVAALAVVVLGLVSGAAVTHFLADTQTVAVSTPAPFVAESPVANQPAPPVVYVTPPDSPAPETKVNTKPAAEGEAFVGKPEDNGFGVPTLPPVGEKPAIDPRTQKKADDLAAGAPGQAKAKRGDKLTFKRRDKASDEDLRKQLAKAPEVKLDMGGPSRKISMDLWNSAKLTNTDRSKKAEDRGVQELSRVVHLQGLPFRMGEDCHLGKEAAENMQEMSRKLRTTLAASQASGATGVGRRRISTGPDTRLDADYIRKKINDQDDKNEFVNKSAVPCMMQMLQPENSPVRAVLADQLGKIYHQSSTEALAKLALYDLDDQVREKAVRLLADRPMDDYREYLISGFKYPWAPVADHAAEALVALQDERSIPILKEMLVNMYDPCEPYPDRNGKSYLKREVVAVNHLSNCMMCHAPSVNPTKDLVRGRIPDENKPLPALTQYYEDKTGNFVKAEVTYLKQDFSVPQPVNHPHWPRMQRFDYMVRTRTATMDEVRKSAYGTPATFPTTSTLPGAPASGAVANSNRPRASFPQRDALIYALKELGGL